jgi:glutathione S-transferase
MVYKLIYFPVRGRSMHIRYLLLDNGIDFEVELVTGETWPALKPKTLFGQIPMLKDGDFELVQSNAILRYLARKHGLYGKNNEEAAMIDMINDQQEDMRVAYVRMIYKEYETGKDAYVKALPDALASLEKVLSRNNDGSGFLVGDSISFVDYSVFDILDNHLVLVPSCLDKFPKLKAFHGRMAARPKIAAYRDSDTFKKLPINGNGKQ